MKTDAHAAIRRLMVPAAISILAMISAIITDNFTASLILGLGGAGLFLYVMTKLFEARRSMANERINVLTPKSPPPE